jgi:hypothetical protein
MPTNRQRETTVYKRAAQVHSGTCTIDLSPKTFPTLIGAQNCHAELAFADGEVWLAWSRLSSAISPPTEVHMYVCAAERGRDHGVPEPSYKCSLATNV